MKPNRCYESMSRLKIGLLTIRLWCTEDGPNCGFIGDAQKRLAALSPRLVDKTSAAEMFEVIEAEFPNAAAIEILCDGSGSLVYPDWK